MRGRLPLPRAAWPAWLALLVSSHQCAQQVDDDPGSRGLRDDEMTQPLLTMPVVRLVNNILGSLTM